MRLRREVGLGGAILLGLGAMVGSGVFVSLGLGAGLAGPSVLAALALAAAVAGCNGMSSAQLAASHPVSGGTYEYGYRYLSPWAGFTAGWMFLVAKSASAATAALGCAGYLLHARDASGAEPTQRALVLTALGLVSLVTGVVLAGMRRSNAVNAAIVAVTLLTLGCLVAAGLPRVDPGRLAPLLPPPGERGAFLHATALMFVAYTGYGRIATLGEEVRAPRRTIPLAILVTMAVSFLLYAAVALVGVGLLGAEGFGAAAARDAAPLAEAAERAGLPGGTALLTLGAVTAMLGVLLNLLLGLSRVLLAMGRRGDAPAAFARLDAAGTSPTAAVLGVAALVAVIAALGDVRASWSFSAFTVLVYYSLTNLAALRLPPGHRLYPRWIAWVGLGASAALAFQLERAVWIPGLGLIALGLAWHAQARRRAAAG